MGRLKVTVDQSGVFHKERKSLDDVPVYMTTLLPQDGLYPLPYMARQANGVSWEGDAAFLPALARAQLYRQSYYPHVLPIFEEIDRFGLGHAGTGVIYWR